MRSFCLGFICFFAASLLSAQTSVDVEQIQQKIVKLHTSKDLNKTSVTSLRASQPSKKIFFLLLAFYQTIVSDQISAECEFEMSCSSFGVQAIKELNVFKAICLTSDRLTRCNGAAQLETESHLINNSSSKVIDDPSMYRFNR